MEWALIGRPNGLQARVARHSTSRGRGTYFIGLRADLHDGKSDMAAIGAMTR
jgi:hypothetical protein